MPYADFGQKLSFNHQVVVKLRAKGDTIRFRILGKPYYDAKHFYKMETGKWNVEDCARVMKGEECLNCNEYFRLLSEAKLKAEKMDEASAKVFLEQEKRVINQHRNSISFYYPILNRDLETFNILQTTPGTRAKIEAEFAEGTKVFDYDFKLTRTELPGDYYKFSRIDSRETKPFSEKELKEIASGAKLEIDKIVGGKADDESQTAFAETTKKVSDPTDELEDLPWETK